MASHLGKEAVDGMTSLKSSLLIMATAMGLVCTAAEGRDDLPGDPVHGFQISSTWCGDCHVVEPGIEDMLLGIPSFQIIADEPSMTETALRAFLRTPHAQMPDVMPTRRETDDIIAYILSLREP